MGLTVLAGLAAPSTAGARTVSVLVVPPFAPASYAERGAVGLLVPANGTRVTRAGALAALIRGKTYDGVTGTTPKGTPLIRVARRRAEVTIYVSLPPPGSHPNDRRYPIAIVGAGYHGILTSSSTRIRGLVSLADVAPTALALERETRPRIRAEADRNAVADLVRLDRRIDRAHRTRLAVDAILAAIVILPSLLALALRSRAIARVALLTAPSVLLAGLAASALGITQPWPLGVLLVALALLGSAAAGAVEALLLPAALAVLAAYVVVLAVWPEVNSLSAVGPHVEDGGRFYGITNLAETILLTVALLAASLAGPRHVAPIAALALVAVGWSRTGADGGGILVLAAAFAILALRLSGRPLTWRAAAIGSTAAAALGLALVGIDAASGGKSHVTRAFERGPTGWAGDLAHRVHASVERFTATWHAALVVCVGVAALALLASRRPRFPAGEALLAGLAVSLLVNDSPSDVLGAGAVCYGVLWTWERVRRTSHSAPRLDSLPDAPPRPDPRRLRAVGRRLRRVEDSLPAAEHGRGLGS